MPRTRENNLHLRLSDSELKLLRRKSQKAGIKPQALILNMLKDREIKELPPVEYHEVLKNLRQINNNMNQIAVKANSAGIVDELEYWKNVRWLQEVIGRMMEVMY